MGGRPDESNNPGADKVLGGWGPRTGSNFAWGLRAGRKWGKLSQLRLYDGWKVARRTRRSQRRKRLPGRGNSICKGSVAWNSLSEGTGLYPLGIGEAKGFKQGGRRAALSSLQKLCCSRKMGCHLGQEQRRPAELREQRLEMRGDRIYVSSSGNGGKEGIGGGPPIPS